MAYEVQGAIAAPPKPRATIPLLVILIAFVAFWPVGILLLVIRIATDKGAAFRKSTVNIASAASWILLCASGLLLLFAISEEEPVSTFLITGAICIGGLCSNWYAQSLKKTAALYKICVEFVVNQRMTDLSKISQQADVPYDTLLDGLRKMISLDILPGAQLDALKGTIKIPAPRDYDDPSHQTQAMKCPNCGANGKVVPGENNKCEYCGTFFGSRVTGN